MEMEKSWDIYIHIYIFFLIVKGWCWNALGDGSKLTQHIWQLFRFTASFWFYFFFPNNTSEHLLLFFSKFWSCTIVGSHTGQTRFPFVAVYVVVHLMEKILFIIIYYYYLFIIYLFLHVEMETFDGRWLAHSCADWVCHHHSILVDLRFQVFDVTHPCWKTTSDLFISRLESY